jgi:hypothetical protein
MLFIFTMIYARLRCGGSLSIMLGIIVRGPLDQLRRAFPILIARS